jgi:hypothetical protein
VAEALGLILILLLIEEAPQDRHTDVAACAAPTLAKGRRFLRMAKALRAPRVPWSRLTSLLQGGPLKRRKTVATMSRLAPLLPCRKRAAFYE